MKYARDIRGLAHRSTAKGFTLIETVVSIFVVGAVIAIFAASSSTLSLTRDAKNQDIAMHIANSKLAQIRADGYDALPQDGPFTDPLLSSLPNGEASTTVSVFNDKTKQIDVTVGWKRANAQRTVVLTTLMTETGGL